MQIWNGFQRGINLGGWLSQCDHTDRHYDTFITENDIAHIASWGMDHVRVPIDYELIEAQGSIERESGYARIACCLRWCKKHNLNVVLVLHKTYGYNPESAYASSDFFENPALQARFVSLWNQLAKRFQSYSDILAFELLDQVLEKEHPNRWNRVVAKTIDAIRGICPTVPIVVSGIRNDRAASIPLLQLPADEHLVYGFHCYEPMVFTHQSADWVRGTPKTVNIPYPDEIDKYWRLSAAACKAFTEPLIQSGVTNVQDELFRNLLQPAVETAERNNIPLYCGAYGVIQQADDASTLRWFETVHRIFEEYGIARAVWSYRNVDFGIVDSCRDAIREQLLPLL